MGIRSSLLDPTLPDLTTESNVLQESRNNKNRVTSNCVSEKINVSRLSIIIRNDFVQTFCKLFYSVFAAVVIFKGKVSRSTHGLLLAHNLTLDNNRGSNSRKLLMASMDDLESLNMAIFHLQRLY